MPCEPRDGKRFRFGLYFSLFLAAIPLLPLPTSARQLTGQDNRVAAPMLSAQDIAALKALLETERGAYARKDLAAFMATGHPRSPYRAAREKVMRDLFAKFDRIETESFEFRQFVREGDEARVRIRSVERAVNAADGSPARGFGARNRVYRCIRDGDGAWKIWHYYSAEIDLMNELCAARTAPERAARLDASPEVIYLDLLANLDKKGKHEALEARHDAMVRTYTAYCEVAARSRIRSVEAIGYHQLGFAHLYRNEFVPAMNAYQKSLDIAESQNDPPRISSALNGLGNLHSTLGNHALAAEYLERGKGVAGAGDGAMIHNNLGKVYLEVGDLTRARQQFDVALSLFERREQSPSATDGIAMVRHNRSALWSATGDLREALAEAEKALALREKIGAARGIPPTLGNLAEIHSLLGNDAEALRFVERTESAARAADRMDVLWRAFMTRARVLRNRKDHAGERAALTDAVAVIEGLRTSVAGGEATRQNFLRDKAGPYQMLAQSAVREKRADLALAWTERVRGRVLLDVLTGGRAEINGTLTAAERAKEETLRRELNTQNALLQAETRKPEPNAAAITEQTLRLVSARAAADSHRAVLYAAHPDLKAQRGEVAPITPAQATRLLPDSKSALLEYAVSEHAAFLLVLTGKNGGTDLRAYPLAATREQLIRLSGTFRDRIAARDPSFAREARALHELLIAPAAKQLAGKTNLIIAPDGPLWDLPFQALQTPGGRFLLEDRTLSYTPSWTILREMAALRRKRLRTATTDRGGKKAPAAGNLLAIGNPALSAAQVASEALVYRGSSPSVARMLPLPGAESEVNTLATFYTAGRRRVYVGQEAREGRVKSEAPGARILHFAAHGVLDDRNPLYSHIVLAQNEGTAGDEDGLLEARELLQLPLQADLAVLSACETARGQFSTGEGVVGLTWSLFIAGCPRAVVSQWRVDSEGTTDLMVAFHRNLTGGTGAVAKRLSAAESLRQASLGLLKTQKWRHPFYWAPFVLVGDGG